MAVMMYVLPVVPGQEDRARNFQVEIREHWDEMVRLNGAAGLKHWAVATQEGPQGALQIHMFEADDLSRLGRDFTDSAYDRWWLSYLRDVHGVDAAMMASMQPPPVVFEWHEH
ncbi:MAG: hypothetical protein M3295_10405 [Chloroflexota bacterium]|nr:hypothetical protein [Chloroflexota bacterium]